MEGAAILTLLTVLLFALCVQAQVLPNHCCRFNSCTLKREEYVVYESVPRYKCLVNVSCDIYPGCFPRSPGVYSLNASVCDSASCTRAGRWCWSDWSRTSSGCFQIRIRKCCDARQLHRLVSEHSCQGWTTSLPRYETRTPSHCSTSASLGYRRFIGITCSIISLLLIALGIFFIRLRRQRRTADNRTRPFTVEGFGSGQPPRPVEPVLPPSYEEVARSALPPPPAYEAPAATAEPAAGAPK